jgi:hypothetical protein
MILQRIGRVIEEQGNTPLPLDDDLRISDAGLDSLSIAGFVATLEDELDRIRSRISRMPRCPLPWVTSSGCTKMPQNRASACYVALHNAPGWRPNA